MASVKREVSDEVTLDQVPEQEIRQEPKVEPKPEESDFAKEKTNKLVELISQHAPSINVLEDAVSRSLKALHHLKLPLELCGDKFATQAPQWLKCIADLQNRAKPTRTIVGVVGNTGAGKSSVISAVLDEERLLPTNCMRACTASPTEISYNYSDDPDELYRAEVEFITSEEWIKELQGLFIDLLDGNGDVSRDCSNPDTECGVAYAKIKAVYPRKTKEMIAQSNPDDMANEAAVRSVLGKTRILKATTAASIYQQLQTYVDSKDRNADKTIEYWPLIKVVRIYTKAAALSTGACLVDLPGVQDSNAARAAVAANYMKACTGLWIVAPITRAVDDKTAKSLLGDSFRRQLKYDGIYSAVTFICSKTDDISVTEAAESLGIEKEISESWHKIQTNDADIARIKGVIQDLRDEKKDINEAIDDNDNVWELWDGLLKKVTSGKTVYPPTPNKKRKRKAKPSGSRKNRRSADFSDSDFSDSDASESDKENSQPHHEDREPLTEAQIDAKINELRAEKKELRAKKNHITEKIAAFKKDIKEIAAENKVLNGKVRAICIKGRNEYSRTAIKQDFAMGIKELDQEAAAEADEETFNPDVDLRDYDKVAESLPVFCVSSRAFQSLSDRLVKDNFNSLGFLTPEDTEVPQLQEHARKLTVDGRVAHCRRFLNDFVQLVTSMTLWAADDGTKSSKLSDTDKKAEEDLLHRQLDSIEEILAKAVTECVTDIQAALGESIFSLFNVTIQKAIDEAVPTATSWGGPRDKGGMVWSTYKATCRRYGVHSGTNGARDLNAELFEPISRHLASGWEKAFQNRTSGCLQSFAQKAKTLVETFHNEATKKAQERGTDYQGLTLLNQQLRGHIERVTDIPKLMGEVVQGCQRDANRNFTPVIQEKMRDGYQKCIDENGTGSFARMKVHMLNHVEAVKHTMFHDATRTVRTELDEMCRKLQEQLRLQIEDITGRLKDDYLAVLVGASPLSWKNLPRTERLLRMEMAPLLATIDIFFEGLAEVQKDDVEEDLDPIQMELMQEYHEQENSLVSPPPSDAAAMKDDFWAA